VLGIRSQLPVGKGHHVTAGSQAGGSTGMGDSIQPDAGVWKGSSGGKKWGNCSNDRMPADGGCTAGIPFNQTEVFVDQIRLEIKTVVSPVVMSKMKGQIF
jgi:hypothetical protein